MNIVLIGATSAIAQATARQFAGIEHAAFLLVGRDAGRLGAVAGDLRVRGAAKVECLACELAGPSLHEDAVSLMTRAESLIGPADLVLIAHGELSDEARASRDFAYAAAQLALNATSPMLFAFAAANYFRQRANGGHIAVITSVAGERGRSSNFLYGASKAGLIAFLSGLRASLYPLGVAVTDLRPGFIATPMTAHLKRGPLFCSAERAGQLCAGALRRRVPVAYIPGFWRLIMFIVRAIPERVFQRLRF